MGQQISRRTFLRGGLAAAAGVAASSIPGSEALAQPDETRQLATLLDISKCIGCGECVAACSEANADKYPDPQKPFPKKYPTGRTNRISTTVSRPTTGCLFKTPASK